MGKVIQFSKAAQARPPRGLAIDEPRNRALLRLANSLRDKKFTAPSDREHLGRNWHAILRKLKDTHGLKSKESIYAVLQKAASLDDAQKKSQQYEIPPTLPREAVERRRRQLTQDGKRWLKLAERAAESINEDRHHFLPRLLEGTSIAPASITPTLDTPEPMAALLQLANAACARVAALADLKKYFQDWTRSWVIYRSRDEVFFPAHMEQDLDDSEDEWSSSHVGNQFFFFGDELESRRFDGALPIPSVPFAVQLRLAPIPATLETRDQDQPEAGEDIPQQVKFHYIREFRLGIGLNAVDDTIAPVLEIRHRVVIMDPVSGMEIPFQPQSDLPDAPGFFEYYRESMDDPDTYCDGNNVFIPGLSGLLNFPSGTRWGYLTPEITPEQAASAEACLAALDEGYPLTSTELETHYVLLTPKSAESLLKVRCEPTKDLNEARTLTGSSGEALKTLEAMLLEGTRDGSASEMLLADARRKAEGFRRIYDAELAAVLEDHRKALTDYITDR